MGIGALRRHERKNVTKTENVQAAEKKQPKKPAPKKGEAK